MIEVKNIQKKYQNKIVLKNVSSVLPNFGLVAFIGSNGAGKSTLLNIIGRLLNSEEGTVLIDGKKHSEFKPDELAKKISVLSQQNHINIRLTVRELIAFGRFPYSKGKLTKEDETKIDEAIEMMELENLENRYLDQLSGGQRQLAYIAMILCQDTQYIFLDEPLNNLDMKHSAQLMRILKRIIERTGKTIFVVIHDINFVSTYADYIVALKDGHIVYQGVNDDIITEDVLSDIFDFKIKIKQILNQKICLYYQCHEGDENLPRCLCGPSPLVIES